MYKATRSPQIIVTNVRAEIGHLILRHCQPGIGAFKWPNDIDPILFPQTMLGSKKHRTYLGKNLAGKQQVHRDVSKVLVGRNFHKHHIEMGHVFQENPQSLNFETFSHNTSITGMLPISSCVPEFSSFNCKGGTPNLRKKKRDGVVLTIESQGKGKFEKVRFGFPTME